MHMRAIPLGGLNLVEADFAWATRVLMDVADRHSNGHVVSVLEGGYDLEGPRPFNSRSCHDPHDRLNKAFLPKNSPGITYVRTC